MGELSRGEGISLIRDGDFRVGANGVSDPITGIASVAQRFFTTLKPASFDHFIIPTLTLTGDFEIEMEFVRLSDTTQVLLGEIGATSDFIACFAGNSFQLRLNGSNVPAVIFTNADDGKLHKIRYKRIAGVITTFFDGVLKATDTNANTFTTDRIGRNLSGIFWDGIIANVRITDAGTLIRDYPIGENWIGNLILRNAAGTGQEGTAEFNITSADAELFTLIDGDWLGAELVVNGGFDTDTDWTKGTGWSISSGVAIHTAGTGANNQSMANVPNPLTAGRTYSWSYACTSFTSGSVHMHSGGSVFTGSTATSLSSLSGVTTVVASNLALRSSFSLDFTGEVDNVSVKRILEVA